MKAQKILLVLEDGRVIEAVCPAFMDAGESIVLKKVLVAKPVELPPDYRWEEISQNETSAKEVEG